MDKRTASGFVARVEAHREKESAIWQEMRRRPDYEMHEDKTITAIIDARKRAHNLLEEAESDLAAFDWVDDGTGNFVPRDEVTSECDEPIWPEMSAKLREMVGADKKLLAMIDQIDRLHKHAVEKGFPVVTRAQFEAATEAVA